MDIKKASVKDIHKVITQDLTEIHLKLQKILGAGNPFAEFHIGGGFYVWTTSSDEWKPLTSASTMQQELVRERLSLLKEDTASKIGQKTAEAIFTVPDDSYIFYVASEDGIKILLAGWCFKKPVRINPGPEVGVIDTKNPVNVAFSCNGQLQPHFKFGVQLEKQVKTLVTGADGYFHFQDLKVQEHYMLYAISYDNREYALTIAEGQHDYIFELPYDEPEPENPEEPEELIEQEPEHVAPEPEPEETPEPSIKVMIRDYTGKPMKCHCVEFSQEGQNPITVQLDSEGNTYLLRSTFLPQHPVQVGIQGNERPCPPIRFTLEENESEYLLQERVPEKQSVWPLLFGILFILALILLPVIFWEPLEDFIRHEQNVMFN